MERPGAASATAAAAPQAGYERLTADEMDERRRQNVAYQYLCHLEEAKRWMEACLKEPLASPTELEESLRNGVILAKLGHFFAPDMCPLGKIYDLDQARFKACGLHFRHTDNINRWRDAMSHIGLPTIFHPETTDIYDKKNMPRVVYCIHALSLYLFKLGLAPQIQDLYGKVKFTEEEINHMKRELEKYGLHLPSFSKIGGILADELSVDEAAVHAAVLAINQALEAGVMAQTVAALRNPNARLSGLREPLGAVYQEELLQAKVDKAQNAKNRRLRERRQDEDLYDRCLTQSEIQAHIHKANVKSALEMVDDALELLDAEGLCSALQDPSLALRNLRLENGYWYLEQLSADREQKSLEMGYVDLLEREEIQAGLYEANERGDRERAATEAVRHINAAIRRGVSEETAQALADPAAQLPDIFFFAAGLYQRELSLLQKQHPQGALVQEELFVAIEMLSAVALVNQALEDRDARSFWRSLASPGLGLSDLEESNAQCYFEELLKLKEWLPPDPRTHFLSWNDIQASVRRVNASVQEENEKIVAVRLINEALEHGSPEKTLTALLLPSAGLQDVVRLPVAKRYHEVLRQMLKQKTRVTEDTGAALWWEEIVKGVARANLDTEAAKRMALGVAAINQAIKEGNAAQTARVLCNPDVSLCGVAAECAEAYQAELGALMATRSKAGDPKKPWVQHRARDGMAYFFSLQAFEGSWEHPPLSALNTTHLGREEIQATIAKVTAALDRQRLWESSVGLVIRLQARMRGFLARQAFAARKHLLSEQVPAATKIQACWRGYQQQRRYLERLGFLRRNTEATIKIQAWVRMWAARKRYLERLRYFRENVWAVIKIQAFVRANKARGDYKLLVYSRNPPLGVVRRFAHLLERSQQDYWEELELLEVQEGVVKGIRSNQQLEKDLGLMDVKIGLLVKNRITLQEVVSHCKKLTKRNKEQLSDLMGPGKDQGLKALSKDKRKTLEAYQHLFYQLQTHPVYLARLILQMPQNKSTKFMETVVFTLYNYASNSREAYLLLQLFRTALQEEIHSRVTQIRDVLTGNPTVIRMVVSFYRNARGQNALREILAGPVQDVLQNRALSIRTSPVEIYRGWINQTESQMGQKSPLPYDVTPEQALGHPEVQRRLDISLRHLLTVTDTFLSAITSSVDKLPYGMRYIAKVLKTSLTEKFPQSPSGDIDKVVGNLLYYRFMNPAVVAPDGFDIVDFSAGVALHPDHRRNLGSVAKILQHAAAGQLFEGENGHLRGVNRYLEETHLRFREFIRAACLVPDPEERFDVDKYSDTIALTKPVVYITAEEIVNTHKLLLEHQGFVAPDPGDPLHELLEDLGGLPTVHMLIGGKGGPGASEQLAKGEISLTLNSKFEATVAKAEDRTDTSTLLLSTKQLLVDVIQSQPGDSLVEVLQMPASEDQEVVHQQLMKRRAQREAQAPAWLRSHHPLAADTRLSLKEKKRKILKNLRPLESLGLVAAGNQYQEILNEMAQDICNQRRYRQRRKAELARLQRTLGGLHAKRRFHEEQVDFYRQYLRTCLDNLAARNRSSKKQAALHYTGAQLYEKGVLLGIDDLPVSQLKNVIFEIVPSEEAGEFQVQTKFMGIAMERFPLHYQELLQLQYEGVAVMKMFDKAKVNVNLLIFLLNKKFFKK